MNKEIFLIIIFSIILKNIQAQSTLNQFVQDPDVQHAGVSFCAIDIAANRIVAEHNADLSLIPASSLKVVTTATALGILGADYRFETRLEYDGQLSANGTLRGNVYITGTGDPTLASPDMEGVKSFDALMQNFVDAIKKAGIRRIEGFVVGDASFYETAATGRTWIWEDMGNYYAGGAYGLNIHENLYYMDFRLSPTLNQAPTFKTTRPEVPDLQVFNELQSAGAKSGDNAYIFGSPYTRTRYIRGTLPIGAKTFTIKGSIPEPAYFAAHHLSENLEKNGIYTGDCVTTQRLLLQKEKRNLSRKVIATIQSPPLKKIVERANMKSVNLYCESLLKAMGQRKSGKGTSTAGLEAIQDYWTERGVNMKGCIMKDGSGLSPRNAVSAKHFAQIMRKIAKDPTVFDHFYDSLPVAARSGSLSGMFKGTKAAGNLRAKSGYMEGVRSYTGYVKNAAGKDLAFSIIVNNYSGSSGDMRRKIEQLLLGILD